MNVGDMVTLKCKVPFEFEAKDMENNKFETLRINEESSLPIMVISKKVLQLVVANEPFYVFNVKFSLNEKTYTKEVFEEQIILVEV